MAKLPRGCSFGPGCEPDDGPIANNAQESGLCVREKLGKDRGATTKVRLGKDEYGFSHREHKNSQEQGPVF